MVKLVFIELSNVVTGGWAQNAFSGSGRLEYALVENPIGCKPSVVINLLLYLTRSSDPQMGGGLLDCNDLYLYREMDDMWTLANRG